MIGKTLVLVDRRALDRAAQAGCDDVIIYAPPDIFGPGLAEGVAVPLPNDRVVLVFDRAWGV